MEEKKDISVVNTENEPDDLSLVQLARKGNKPAFGQLVKKHQKRALRMVLGMVGDLDTAMDIVQDSFIRAYQALDRFDETRPFYPWLSTIAGNLSINFLKKRRREVGFDPEKDILPDKAANPLEKLRLKENEKRFKSAVDNLPDQYRIVFILRNFEDLSYSEIAKRLNISPGTVDSRLYRARRILMDDLKELLE